MILKLLGALFVVFGCGGFGFMIASAHKAEVKALQRLIVAVDYICCELQYRQTPLPELCQQASEASGGIVGDFFSMLSVELDKQISPNASKCAETVLESLQSVPMKTKDLMAMLGNSLGRFDLQGQLKDLETVRAHTEMSLQACTANQDTKLRSYQTLALCAGAALAILFV